MMAAGKHAHGRAAERGGRRPPFARVHHRALDAAEHERGAADAAQLAVEVAGAVAVERQHGAVEAEGPVARRALGHGMVREIGDHRRGHARLVGHEAEGAERRGAGRIAAALPSPRDTTTPPRRQLGGHVAHPAIEQRQALRPLGVARGPPRRDAAAHGVGDECHASGGEGPEQGVEVGGEVLDAVGRRVGPVALAVAAQVRRDDPPARHECGHERIPPVRVSAVAVEEHDGRVRLAAPGERVQHEAPGTHAHRHGCEPAGHGRDQRRPVGAHVHRPRKRAIARGTTRS